MSCFCIKGFLLQRVSSIGICMVLMLLIQQILLILVAIQKQTFNFSPSGNYVKFSRFKKLLLRYQIFNNFSIKLVRHKCRTSCDIGCLFEAVVHNKKISLSKGAVGELTRRTAAPISALVGKFLLLHILE